MVLAALNWPIIKITRGVSSLRRNGVRNCNKKYKKKKSNKFVAGDDYWLHWIGQLSK